VDEGSLSFKIDYVEGVNQADSIQTLRTEFTGRIHKENYDYSAMTSAYLPLDLSFRIHAMKVINSVHEPTGNSFFELSQIPKYYEMISKILLRRKRKSILCWNAKI